MEKRSSYECKWLRITSARALTSGRRLLKEKSPGFGLENVRCGCSGLSRFSERGTGPPRLEKVRWRGFVKNLGPGVCVGLGVGFPADVVWVSLPSGSGTSRGAGGSGAGGVGCEELSSGSEAS